MKDRASERSAVFFAADPLREPQVKQMWQGVVIVVGLLVPMLVALSTATKGTGDFLDWVVPVPQTSFQTAVASTVVAAETVPTLVPAPAEPSSLVASSSASLADAPGARVEPAQAATPQVDAAAPPVVAVRPRVAVVANAPRVVLDDLPPADGDTTGWPNDTSSKTWFNSDGYILSANAPDHFVAVSIPVNDRPTNVRVSAQFQKIGGPSGGGYGLIIRDRSPAALDGEQQFGSFLIFEVGDRGEFGVWRRAGDVWEDLITWQASSAVRTDEKPNVLSVEAIDSQLNFTVNGVTVATLLDDQPGPGGVGAFLGGDFNAAVLQHLHIEALP